MQGWRLGFLGIETTPPWPGELKIEQLFRLSPAEIARVKIRRGNDMQRGLGLDIGILRMSGLPLNSNDLILIGASWLSLTSLFARMCRYPLLWLFNRGWEDPGWGRMPINQVALGSVLHDLGN